ncbi:hypothetical protein H0X32_03085 [Patescibacteria group bacterium]|nr:hypothetical protein [Patescibacteria group bacterium]
MEQRSQQYIHRVAASVLSQIGDIYDVESRDTKMDFDTCPCDFWVHHGSKVMRAVGKMGSSARGRIAACGVPPHSPSGSVCHWEVNKGEDLNTPHSGDQLLTLLASYVVVAAIVDLIRSDIRKLRRHTEEQHAHTSH